MTATRASGFGAAGSSGLADGPAAGGVDAAVTAAAIGTGPRLSIIASVSFWPAVSAVIIDFTSPWTATLRSLVSANGCAVRPSTPLATGVTDRDSGYAVMTFRRCEIGCV